MPTIDLRKKDKPVKKETVKPIQAVSVEGMPLTDAEYRRLLQTGWKPGAVIPPGLLEAVRNDLTAPLVPVKVQPPEDGGPVTFEQLSDEDKLKLTGGIPAQQVDAPELDSIDPETAKALDPSIVAFMKASSDLRGAKITAKVEQPADPDKPAQEEVPYAGGLERPPNCPHCGWLLKDFDDPKPSAEDKSNFIQAVLGGTRFRKRYEFLGGKVTVTFRSLIATEADLAFNQTAYDTNGMVRTEDHFFRNIMDYRLAMGLESVTVDGITTEVPEIGSEDFVTDDPPKDATKLIFMVPFIYDRVLKTESVRRFVGAAFCRFQRLVEKLEARADDPDFWNGTEGQF